MNVFYDFNDAGARLSAHFARSGQQNSSAVFLPSMDTQRVKVEEFGNPACWRLIEKATTLDGVQDEEVEVVVQIPGILCRSMLPPFTRHISANDKSIVRSLRQYVKVTGIGNHYFDQMEEKLAEVEGLFRNAVGDGGVKPLKFNEYDGEFAIDAHCLYFTDRRVDPAMKHERFQVSVDPEMKLELARGDDFVHGQENIVQYVREVIDGKGSTRYEEVCPSTFQNGDIVELRVAFICYRLHEGGHKVVPTLRSLIMISSATREVAAKQLQELENANAIAAQVKTSTKRKRVHGERNAKVVKRKFITIGWGEESINT